MLSPFLSSRSPASDHLAGDRPAERRPDSQHGQSESELRPAAAASSRRSPLVLVLFAFVILTVARAASADDMNVDTEQDGAACSELPPGKVIIELNDRLLLVDAYRPAAPTTSHAHRTRISRASSARPVSAALRIQAANFDADAEADGWRVSSAILDRTGRPSAHRFTVKYELLAADQPALLQPAFLAAGRGQTTRQASQPTEPRVLQTWHDSSGSGGRGVAEHLLKINSSALTRLRTSRGGSALRFRSDSELRRIAAALPFGFDSPPVGSPATKLLIRARISVPGSGVFVATEPVGGFPATVF